MRHDLFAPNINENIKTSDSVSRKFVLKYAENLLSSSTVYEVVMLGLLSKFKEGKFYLEDPSGAIPIDLSEAKFHSGLYTEGAFMLAEGTYNDGVLKVSGLGFPPPEAASSGASSVEKELPQPQERTAFGLSILKPPPITSST